MFEFTKPQRLIQIEPRMPEFYLKDFLPIPKNAITMISAAGGSGKTFLAIQIAIRFVQEEIHEFNDSKVLLWLSEDPIGLTRHRADVILSRIPKVGTHFQNVDVIDDMPQHLNLDNFSKYKELFREYDLVVLDPLIAFYGGEENSNSEARFFMNLLNKIARDNRQSFIIIHHAGKGQEQKSRGAGAFVDAVRLSYEIKIMEDTIKREIVVAKDNYGVKQIIGNSKIINILPYQISFENIVDDKQTTQQPKTKKSIWEVI